MAIGQLKSLAKVKWQKIAAQDKTCLFCFSPESEVRKTGMVCKYYLVLYNFRFSMKKKKDVFIHHLSPIEFLGE